MFEREMTTRVDMPTPRTVTLTYDYDPHIEKGTTVYLGKHEYKVTHIGIALPRFKQINSSIYVTMGISSNLESQ